MSEKFDKVLANANEALNKMKSPIERERNALKQQLAEAVEVLGFYGQKESWVSNSGKIGVTLAWYDMGAKARAFLQKIGMNT